MVTIRLSFDTEQLTAVSSLRHDGFVVKSWSPQLPAGQSFTLLSFSFLMVKVEIRTESMPDTAWRYCNVVIRAECPAQSLARCWS